MKHFILALCVVLAILIGGWRVSCYLDETVAEMVSVIDDLIQQVGAQRWGPAQDGMATFEAQWIGKKHIWAYLISHVDIEGIDTSLVRAKMGTKLQAVEETLLELAELKQRLKQVPEKYSLRLNNIF